MPGNLQALVTAHVSAALMHAHAFASYGRKHGPCLHATKHLWYTMARTVCVIPVSLANTPPDKPKQAGHDAHLLSHGVPQDPKSSSSTAHHSGMLAQPQQACHRGVWVHAAPRHMTMQPGGHRLGPANAQHLHTCSTLPSLPLC